MPPFQKRMLSPEERRLGWHCSRVLSENHLRFPCDQEAVVLYEMPDGVRVGWCFRHMNEGAQHAKFRGWTLIEQVAA